METPVDSNWNAIATDAHIVRGKYIHMCMYVCLHVCMHACMYMFVVWGTPEYMYVCMYVTICIEHGERGW